MNICKQDSTFAADQWQKLLMPLGRWNIDHRFAADQWTFTIKMTLSLQTNDKRCSQFLESEENISFGCRPVNIHKQNGTFAADQWHKLLTVFRRWKEYMRFAGDQWQFAKNRFTKKTPLETKNKLLLYVPAKKLTFSQKFTGHKRKRHFCSHPRVPECSDPTFALGPC